MSFITFKGNTKTVITEECTKTSFWEVEQVSPFEPDEFREQHRDNIVDRYVVAGATTSNNHVLTCHTVGFDVVFLAEWVAGMRKNKNKVISVWKIIRKVNNNTKENEDE